MIKIELLKKNTEFLWEDFVRTYVKKEYGFLLKWRDVLKEVFGYSNFYYLIKDGEDLIGIFPTTYIKSKIFGYRLVSIPFTDMGGFYFIPGVKDDVRLEAFYGVTDKLREDLNISSSTPFPLEIRGPSFESNDFLVKHVNFVKASPYVKFIIDLDTEWKNIEDAFSRNIKRNILKAKNELEIEYFKEEGKINDIYDIYLMNMKKLGSLPLPLIFFKKLWEKFRADGNFIVFTASYNKKTIGAITLIGFKGTLYADLIMSDPRYDYLIPKVQLYLHSINYAWRKKYLQYDFNRTRRQSGVFEHKCKWGGSIEEIHYLYQNDHVKNKYFLDSAQNKFLLINKMLKYCPASILKACGRFSRKQIGK